MASAAVRWWVVATVWAACLGEVGAKTWMVTIPRDTSGSSSPCTTPKNCTLPGAVHAASPGDTVKITTPVTLSNVIYLGARPTGSGTIKIQGGGHPLKQDGAGFRIFTLNHWGEGGVTIHISDMIVQGWEGPNTNDGLICLSVDGACGDALLKGTGGKDLLASDSTLPPFKPSLILDNIEFIENTASLGAVEMWDSRTGGGGYLGCLVTECTFLRNIASEDSLGGSILSLQAQGVVRESLFEGNQFATALIRAEDSGAYPISLSQVKAFANEYTGESNDGWMVKGPSSNVSIYYTTFQNNGAKGIVAKNLVMVGSLLKTPNPGPPGEDQIKVSGGVSIGETSLQEEGQRFFISTESEGMVYIRNPTNTNTTVTGASGSQLGNCGNANEGPLGCDPTLPCKDLYSSTKEYEGYRCAPLQ